jgi:hypothetical protein
MMKCVAARRASRPPETTGQEATVEVIVKVGLHEHRAPQLEQTPRCLQLKATRCSA